MYVLHHYGPITGDMDSCWTQAAIPGPALFHFAEVLWCWVRTLHCNFLADSTQLVFCLETAHSFYSLVKFYSWESLKYLWAKEKINVNCLVDDLPNDTTTNKENTPYKAKCNSYCQNRYHCFWKSAHSHTLQTPN